MASGNDPAIPLFDLRLSAADLAAVEATLRSGWLTMGPRVDAFESAFAAALGARHAVCVSSCTAALHLAYLGAGVGPGDEVIVPSVTFAATANAALYCGATPVFADIRGPHDPGIDPVQVASLIGPRTRAVCAVHFAGYPAAVDVLRELCRQHGIALIEDVAHAPMATLGGRSLGTIGLAGAFSFFSNKILSCGEGGLLLTDDDDVAALARRLRSQGMTSGTWSRHTGATDTYDASGLGYNYRLDEPRAALLHSRLERLPEDIDRRRELVRRYRSLLCGLDGLIVPFRDEDVATSACYVMPVLVADQERQGPLRRHLRENRSVQTSLFYPAVHEFSAYEKRFGEQSLPESERWARSELTIPLYPHMTVDQQDRVVEAIAEGLHR
ncbi:dTDP-4-amino-4,6-dideoxygalactose transaminase [Actinomycetospora succinea]|uniref:dTDP-4-amino-4,6-dideoxygalactose transaminase n=1 Tax=Actinomycetospora succinea TaxID=663603 RepID=A0A4R6UNX7_9PSEU|nr:DegT/DnrJ/EryC1/StrS family aminotransferase [Actinomycetospora succinea]TDQ48860.1 dTDP-4-amino-4,6-dideoxygalactose transaminase [Actinomycetospora succinea]